MSSTAMTKATGASLEKIQNFLAVTITDAKGLADAFRAMQEHCNIVTPIANVASIMPMHGISLRAVVIDPTIDDKGNGPEVYRDSRFCKADERAPGKVALMKLLNAGGVQVVAKNRLDDRSDPNYCEIEVILAIQDYDGMHRQFIASKAMDLRDGAADTMKKEGNKMVRQDESAIADKRRHIQSHAETKAIERGLRGIFGLKQKYTVAELQRPFIIPKLVPNLDVSDPDVKAAVLDHALNAGNRLYGPKAALLTDPAMARTRTMRDVTPPREQTAEAVARAQEKPAEPAEDPRDFEMGDFPPEEKEEPAIIVCLCPCGDQRQVTKNTADMGMEKVGTVRCSQCFPGEVFDYNEERHPKDMDLKYPKAGRVITPDDVRKMVAARRK
jgi:hypothetical protein